MNVKPSHLPLRNRLPSLPWHMSISWVTCCWKGKLKTISYFTPYTDTNCQSPGQGFASTYANYSITINYRLITAYLLLRVNLDKIMHARWDFDASSARTRRVSALDKHQNWSASALFCLNSRAQSKYAVVNLIHTRRKQTFCLLLCDK